jgi:hypothetical protein
MNAGLNTPTCLPGSTRDGPIFMIPAENSFSISKAFSSLEPLDVWCLTFSVSGKHHKGSAKNLSFPHFVELSGSTVSEVYMMSFAVLMQTRDDNAL